MNPSTDNHPYTISIPAASLDLFPLKMGGTNPAGIHIGANNRFLTRNGQPWIPVMGEFHFSRYPKEAWEDELLKMKAGGIDVVATYIFWIHVEEEENIFQWNGNNDLRHFIQLCACHGLYAYPRIGPWAHGECRNGGFPDWLLKQCGREVRQDAPRYLQYVRRLYQQISLQLQGLLWKDGGPVIGVQLENELINNALHIRTLKKIAREVGIEVPLYTMTGWGPADVPEGEVIPVFGGYPDAFWDRQTETWARASRKHYFFSYLRDDNTIGADLNQQQDGKDLSYMDQYPHGTCETGGGMQVAYHRRPVINADDIAALAQVKIGMGSNIQGYYMYHGGANPVGKHSTLQESQDTGYRNDLPVIDYDFQAPLGKYGQVRPSYHALRLLHLFLQDFGSRLAPLPLIMPQSVPQNLDDLSTLRWAVRSDGQSGFLFINNYQRIESLPEHQGVQFQLHLPGETLQLPSHPVVIPSGAYGFWPFNLQLNNIQLRYATAQPICQLALPGGLLTVFTSQPGIDAEFCLPGNPEVNHSPSISRDSLGSDMLLSCPASIDEQIIQIKPNSEKADYILVVNQATAYKIWKGFVWGSERLFLSEDSLLIEPHRLRVQTSQPGERMLGVFPAPDSGLDQLENPRQAESKTIFERRIIHTRAMRDTINMEKLAAAGPTRAVPTGAGGVAQAPSDANFENAEVWRVDIPIDVWTGVKEVILSVEYTGDVARAYLDNRLIDDDFYHGRTWEIGLARFLPEIQTAPLILKILPLRADSAIYIPQEYLPKVGLTANILQLSRVTITTITEIELDSWNG